MKRLALLLVLLLTSPASAQVLPGANPSGGGGGGGTGTVTSIATTSPITGGTITTTGTLGCATCVTSAAALTLNLPVIGGGGQASAVGTVSGTTTEFATVTGALTTGHLATWDASGNLIDGGAAASGTVTSIATTGPITGGTITATGTIACATCVTSAAALTANLPVFGSGSQATAVGTRTGNTTAVVTSTGALTTGHLGTWDASGNLIDGGAVPTGLSGLTTTGVLYSTSATAATSDANFEWSSGNQALTILGKAGQTALTLTGPTNTVSAPVLSTTETWNAAAVFTHELHNVTDTSSTLGSALFDYRIGGTSKLKFATMTGGAADDFALILGNGSSSATVGTSARPAIGLGVSSSGFYWQSGALAIGIGNNTWLRTLALEARFASTVNMTWSSGDPFVNDRDLVLGRGSAGRLLLASNGNTFTGMTWTATLFANLGTPAAGTMTYCSDCDAPAAGVMGTCTSAGTKTGAWAFRVNSTPAWGCIGI